MTSLGVWAIRAFVVVTRTAVRVCSSISFNLAWSASIESGDSENVMLPLLGVDFCLDPVETRLELCKALGQVRNIRSRRHIELIQHLRHRGFECLLEGSRGHHTRPG